MNIASYIDHTVLKPTTKLSDVEQLCKEAIDNGFVAVCVPPYYVKDAKNILSVTTVKIATVIGFPFGYSTTKAKLEEIRQAVTDGADELDMVHNLAAFKNGDFHYLEEEIRACTKSVHDSGKIIKLIVESGEMSDEELLKCCKLYDQFPIDFMKTSTGYASVGATVRAVEIMRENLNENIAIKASGGIRNFSFAKELIAAGANRIGCSASVKILEESKSE